VGGVANPWFCLVDKGRVNSDSVIIYGCGRGTAYLLKNIHDLGIDVNISCIVDSDPEKQNKTMYGYPVISPKELSEKYQKSDVIIGSTIYVNEITKNLLNAGFNAKQIFRRSLGERQYFCSDIMRSVQNEVFIDAGSFDGKTIEDFVMHFCEGSYRKIYALEPDDVNYSYTKQYIDNKQLENIELIHAGAWNHSGAMRFFPNKGASSQINSNGETVIKVVAIDDILRGDKATLIKMDIEGAELEALKGAYNTIKTYKPRLAICVYHKPEDIVSIPEYILKINSEYRLYLRHHRSESAVETVLYAV